MPGAASRKRATSSGLNTTGTLRGSFMVDRCLLRSGIKRHLEKEPQCRDCGVDLGDAGAARRQMQLKAAYILRFGCIGRALEVAREVLDPLHIVVLGLLRELA